MGRVFKLGDGVSTDAHPIPIFPTRTRTSSSA